MRALKPQRKTKKERRRHKRYIIIMSLISIAVIVFLVWFLNQKSLQVSQIIIHGNQNVTESAIIQKLDEHLQKKILWLIPQKNILILSTRSLEHLVENAFPEIYHTHISLKNKTTLVVEVEERKPYSLWCKNNTYRSSFDEECYFTDQRGFIYMKAPYFSDGIFEKIYTDDSLLRIGEQVMDENDFKEFFAFTHFLASQYHIDIAKVVITKENEMLLFLKHIGNVSFRKGIYPFLIYHRDTPYTLLMRNINLLMHNELFQSDLKRYKDRLKFIDLRITNQLRYKFYLDDEWEQLQEHLQENQNISEQENKEYEEKQTTT